MTRSYKMVLLEAMLSRVNITQPISIEDLTEAFIARARRSSKIAGDISASLDDLSAVRGLLEKNPINAWTGGNGGAAVFFRYEGGVFQSNLRSDDPESLTELVRELVDWRLAEYLERSLTSDRVAAGSFEARVSQTNGRPILFLDRKRYPNTPTGDHPVWIEGATYTASFVKVALNKAVPRGERRNALPEILQRWFGPAAGQPGTSFMVRFEESEQGLVARPSHGGD
jgi:hypothetical protein